MESNLAPSQAWGKRQNNQIVANNNNNNNVPPIQQVAL